MFFKKVESKYDIVLMEKQLRAIQKLLKKVIEDTDFIPNQPNMYTLDILQFILSDMAKSAEKAASLCWKRVHEYIASP